MKVEIQCFGVMREYLPEGGDGRTAIIDVPDGGSVADVIAALGAPARLVHAILVNDDPAVVTRELRDGDRITLMPHYSGGRT